MKFQKKYIPLLLGVAMAAGVFIGGKLNFADAPDRLFTSNSKKDKLNRLIDYIDYEYVDEINTDSIVDVTVNGILDNLDPHSTYIPKKEMQRVAENMKGNFVGIGVTFYPYRDSIAVIRPIEGGPSERLGIKSGDRILYANGDTLFGKHITNKTLISKLKGKINTSVTLKVYRRGEPNLLTFKVVRDEVPITSVDAAYMLTKTLGYIKVNRFAESTYKEFRTKLLQLKQQGMTALALDLRGNPGGFLGIAEQLADEFLEDDKLILFTKDKRGRVDKSFATAKGDFENGHIYVLIDENSASASEIIAGALQDNDKGTIVGRRSYGKGLVQREMELGDGSAVRLTVSRYYTPTGRSIQRSYKNGNVDYYNDYYKRKSSGELNDELQIEIADSLRFTTPKGKVVYGGGGIIPDVFVPLDERMQSETVLFLNQHGLFSNFVFEYLDQDRKAFNDWTKADFIDNFKTSDVLLSEFEAFVRLKTQSNITFVAYNKEVKVYLKAELAEQLFGSGAFEAVINKNDAVVKEVIALSKLK